MEEKGLALEGEARSGGADPAGVWVKFSFVFLIQLDYHCNIAIMGYITQSYKYAEVFVLAEEAWRIEFSFVCFRLSWKVKMLFNPRHTIL